MTLKSTPMNSRRAQKVTSFVTQTVFGPQVQLVGFKAIFKGTGCAIITGMRWMRPALALVLTLAFLNGTHAYIGDEIWTPPGSDSRRQLVELDDNSYERCLRIDEFGALETADDYNVSIDENTAWFIFNCFAFDPIIEPYNTYGI